MLRKILLGVTVNALALYIATVLLPEITYTGGVKFFVVGGFIIGFLNTFVRPLMKILSLPVLILTFGLFSFVINVIIFWLMTKSVNAIHISDVSVAVNGVLNYIVAAFVFAVSNWVLHLIIRNK